MFINPQRIPEKSIWACCCFFLIILSCVFGGLYHYLPLYRRRPTGPDNRRRLLAWPFPGKSLLSAATAYQGWALRQKPSGSGPPEELIYLGFFLWHLSEEKFLNVTGGTKAQIKVYCRWRTQAETDSEPIGVWYRCTYSPLASSVLLNSSFYPYFLFSFYSNKFLEHNSNSWPAQPCNPGQ